MTAKPDPKIAQKLIIFTRYPEPGKTKTRMIPILGEEGAAQLQRQMTEFTLKIAKKIEADGSTLVAIYFAGGNETLMQQWLGKDLIYQKQSEGDLGQRMHSAYSASFLEGMKKVVIIGTDCPDLDENIINQAFQNLSPQNLVLGPAADGGYYLIGLSRPYAALFEGINWGSSEVLAQTEAIARQLDLRVSYLPVLEDVDRPEDLWIWQNKSYQ
ncbi:TIGR04282 family arsenosugar biosynthesis glycosyltransferase [Gloeothece verrucosa]|uniref:Glycosyltransferase n=1 Tax=Gloeothece verrucosa (strain PCC 7822) TaxID=497965 RepID=E0UJT6_GLOV7|nr:TIGR04282 family arsenosugar biosynthesis glycosyltransferase [Gloeothece verrucosa]ADN13447.1 Protein of unknown function DUF2064 [Gloeothece verrucosa PCC 7822]